MFCPKCGHTLSADAQNCANCGQAVGDSRFDGVPYTSAQARIAPGGGEYAHGEPRPYTKTTYTGIDEKLKSEQEVDERTSYRPIYEGASVPENIRKDVRVAAGMEQPDPEQDSVPRYEEDERIRELFGEPDPVDDFDLSQLRPRPIESKGRAGISRDVSEYVQKLEQSEKGSRRSRRRKVYGEGEDLPPAEGTPAEAEYQDLPPETFDGAAPLAEEEEYASGSPTLKLILKVAGALVVVAALVVGGLAIYRKVSDIRANTSPIDGVTQELYTNGITLIQQHADQTYVDSLLTQAEQQGATVMLGTLTADDAAIQALLPEEPQGNDELFVSVLSSIQSNISSAVTMDMLALSQEDKTNVESESRARWQIINDSIANLSAATSASDLQAILGGEKIDVVTPEPEPTVTPKAYATLSKGDKSNEVLEMQERLWQLGWLLGERDGVFGNDTQTAVKYFQQAVGVDVTGIADSATLTLLYSDEAPTTQYAQVTSTPTATPTPTPTATPETPAEETLSEQTPATSEEETVAA